MRTIHIALLCVLFFVQGAYAAPDAPMFDASMQMTVVAPAATSVAPATAVVAPVAAVAPPQSTLDSVAISALEILAPVILALLGLLAKKAHDLIDAKVKEARLRGILHRLDDAAFTVVRSVEQRIVSVLDPTKKLADGGIAVRDAALAELRSHLGQRGINEVKAILGVTDDDLEKLLASYLESHVLDISTPSAKAKAEVQS